MVKGCFVGSGSDGLQQPEVAKTILQLAGKSATDITVLYLGTATYDLPAPKMKQTLRFVEAGCTITEIKCVQPLEEVTPPTQMEALCATADVILVSGGNTLYAVDTWNKIGLTSLLHTAAQRGAVLTGGSAGAICWFDAGHSDSGDPDSYKDVMLQAAVTAASAATSATSSANASTSVAQPSEKTTSTLNNGSSVSGDESSDAPTAGEVAKSWDYVRVPCLGFLPGLVCPHADKIQSNGVLRATDFDAMLLRHPQETGICIDHFAALVVENDRYRVLSLSDQPGSVLPGGRFSADRRGVPGIWLKRVVTSAADSKITNVEPNTHSSSAASSSSSSSSSRTVQTILVPNEGHILELLVQLDEEDFTADPRIDAIRAANPISI
mmetsp:Transcript_24896/g.41492  ORF Transcript_24896/g.41492 Transcript_24896/m.41492 type:complete len:381 (+) Transcript_24896:173-1315(+)